MWRWKQIKVKEQKLKNVKDWQQKSKSYVSCVKQISSQPSEGADPPVILVSNPTAFRTVRLMKLSKLLLSLLKIHIPRNRILISLLIKKTRLIDFCKMVRRVRNNLRHVWCIHGIPCIWFCSSDKTSMCRCQQGIRNLIFKSARGVVSEISVEKKFIDNFKKFHFFFYQ